MGRKAALWTWAAGPHGSRVRVGEREPGGFLYAFTAKPGGKGGWLKRSLKHRDRDRAMREATELVGKRQQGEDPMAKLTVAAMFALYDRSTSDQQCPRHLAEVRRTAEMWVKFLGGSTAVETIGPSHWERLQQLRRTGTRDSRGEVVEEAKDRRPVGARTQARELAVLKAACARATRERNAAGAFILAVDPTRDMVLPREKNPQRPTADTARYEKLLDAAPGVRMRRGWGKGATWEPAPLPLLLRLAGDTGRRIGALVALRWSDWMPSESPNGSLRWQADYDKLGKDWITPVTVAVRAEVAAEMDRRGIGEGDASFIFPAPNNPTKPVSPQVATEWLRRAEKLAGLAPMPRGAWHAFRRMFAISLKRESPRDVAYLGGWKDTATMQGSYQAPDSDGLEHTIKSGQRVRGVRR